MSKELHLSIYSEHLGLQSFMFYGVTVAAIKYAEFLSNDPEICAAHIIAFFHTPEEAQSGHMVKLLEFSRSCFFFLCVSNFLHRQLMACNNALPHMIMYPPGP
jgi:hypothetical protein